jgi:ribosome-binding ATPase YchF (GTP1/OBG family)
VVRAFTDPAGTASHPKGDIADLETELILADLEVVERRLERLEASIKKKRTDTDVKEQAILQRLKPALESETPIRAVQLSEDDARALAASPFLTRALPA